MIEARRRAYLEALGMDVWVVRAPQAEGERLVFGPGQAATALICGTAADCSGKLAGDIARTLGGAPLWAWPGQESDGDAERLEEAVSARLLTRVIVLGERLAHQLFGAGTPEVIGSARVDVAPSLQELGVDPASRRRLWEVLQGQGCVAGKLV